MSVRWPLAVTILVVLCGPAPAQDGPLFDAAGYRLRDFRSETGRQAPDGALTIDTEALRELLASGQALAIDVLPTPPRPSTLRDGGLWLPPERNDIPGSLWLPDLGLPALSAARDQRFRAVLEPARRAGRTVVAYCLENCWLSWNAARRLVAWGFTDVRWYPGGTDRWVAAGLPTQAATPAVRPEEFQKE